MIRSLFLHTRKTLEAMWNGLVKWPIVFCILAGMFLGASSPDVFSSNVILLLENPVVFYNESHGTFVLYAALASFFVCFELCLFLMFGRRMYKGDSSGAANGGLSASKPHPGNKINSNAAVVTSGMM